MNITLDEFRGAKLAAEEKIATIINELSADFLCAVELRVDKYSTQQISGTRAKCYIYQVEIEATF